MEGQILDNAVSSFREVCDRAYEEQKNFLLRIIKKNAHTEFGEKYGFEKIHDREDYGRNVPLSDFSDYDESVSRIINGERNILSAEPPVYYNISAGSTGEPKYVPLCREDIEKQHLYEDLTVCGIIKESLPEFSEDELFGCIFNLGEVYLTFMPDGIMNGVRSGAFFRLEHKEGKFDLDIFSAPEEILFPKKLEDIQYLKVRSALSNANITAIHGVFVHRAVGMFTFIEKYWDELIYDIEHGTVSECFEISDEWREFIKKKMLPDPVRAQELKSIDKAKLSDGMLPKIWKKLKYIRTICGKSFNPFSDRLYHMAGNVPFHGFAYASSESNIGIAPHLGVMDEYVLLPDVCYFEFIPEDDMDDPKEILTFEQIEKGKRYELVITTLSGLYRYRIGDIVEVTSFYGKAPAVKICYRKNLVISLLDERVNIMQLENTMKMFTERTGIVVENYCVAGNFDGDVPKYVMYLETENKIDPDLSKALDGCFCENSLGYKSARFINDLGEAEIRKVRKGTFRDYENFCREKGKRTEQAKILRVLTEESQYKFFEEARE